jgi:hypothetical protein
MAILSEGPSGGTGGSTYNDEAQSIFQSDTPIQINFRSGSYVDNIQFVYNAGSLPSHGGGGGSPSTFLLDHASGEFITGISGRYGDYVDSLTVQTNKPRTFTVGGSGGSASYTYTAPPGFQIAATVGRSGDYNDAIGVVLAPLPQQ